VKTRGETSSVVVCVVYNINIIKFKNETNVCVYIFVSTHIVFVSFLKKCQVGCVVEESKIKKGLNEKIYVIFFKKIKNNIKVKSI